MCIRDRPAPAPAAEAERRPSLTRRPSQKLAEADEGIKPAWEAFLAAGEVLDAVACYQRLRAACGVKEGAYGREAFDAVLQPTVVSTVPHKTKSLINALAENWKLRPMSNDGTRVVISGAGGWHAWAALARRRVPSRRRR